MRWPEWRPRHRALAAAGVAIALVAGGIAITHTPVFRVRSVRVEGLSHLAREEAVRMAGLGSGGNVVYFDTGAAERSLLRDPWIAQADVSKSYPSTIVIRVRERRAVAVTVDAAGTRELVAADGVVLAPTDALTALPEIRVDAVGSVVDGDGLRSGAKVVGSLPVPLRARVAMVSVGEDGDVALTLRSGLPVAYGPAVRVGEKGRALAAVLRWAERRGAELEYVDVHVPSAPAARLVGGQIASP